MVLNRIRYLPRGSIFCPKCQKPVDEARVHSGSYGVNNIYALVTICHGERSVVEIPLHSIASMERSFNHDYFFPTNSLNSANLAFSPPLPSLEPKKPDPPVAKPEMKLKVEEEITVAITDIF